MEKIKTNSSLLSSFGLALLGSTCCALPIVLVTLGMGGAVASLVSALPWLATLSQYKAITFSITAVVLVYSAWRLNKATSCSLTDLRRLRWQRSLLWSSAGIFTVSVFAAYAMLPLIMWWESSQ